jgi:DNA integrity scanning protein DisA with diadenylate cyclase activity
MPADTSRGALDALYRESFERGVRYCLPAAVLTRTGSVDHAVAQLTTSPREGGQVDLAWLGGTYRLEQPGRALTDNETKLLRSIGRVLSTRYRIFLDSTLAAERLDLFRGLPEDRFVSAYLDPSPYMRGGAPPNDRVAEAIEVLRISSSSTYENRRINTGVLLFGNQPDPCHAPPPLPDGALPYAQALTMTRTFYRLSDGMRTVALVDGAGRMVELVDIDEWAAPLATTPLPVPCAERFVAHCRATLCGGHVCLVLTPNGEIKAFADGAQVFNFLDGRWRLSDMGEKYEVWAQAIARRDLAERLFTTALNLAERRRGGLFVVLADPTDAVHLVPPADRLDVAVSLPPETESKQQLHYLLRSKSVLDLTPTVLESVARIDGAIVVDRASGLLAFGCILRHQRDVELDRSVGEGGRTAASIAASRYGHVLKVSEDGLVSFFAGGRAVWEI